MTEQILRVYKPKMSAMNLKIEVYADRFVIHGFLQQPSTVFIGDITGFSVTSAGATQSIVHVFGNGTELFNIKLPGTWAQESMLFMRGILEEYKANGTIAFAAEVVEPEIPKQKIYDKWWFIILMTVLIWPVGIILIIRKLMQK